MALLLLWLAARHRRRIQAPLVLVACASAVAGPLSAHAMARDWNHTPPLSSGNVTMACQGRSPEVCVPQATGGELPGVREEVREVFSALATHGVTEPPGTLTDTLAHERYPPDSTADAWWLPLTTEHRSGSLRLALVRQAVSPACRAPDAVLARSAVLWAATVVGSEKHYLAQQRVELDQFSDGPEVLAAARARVAKARELPIEDQGPWYRAELKRACAPGGST